MTNVRILTRQGRGISFGAEAAAINVIHGLIVIPILRDGDTKEGEHIFKAGDITLIK